MASSSEFKEMFLQEKPAKMLVFLKEGDEANYATEVSKGIDCTYSHTIKVLDQFEDKGLVEFTKEGRIKLIELTERGEDIAHDLEGLMRKFERSKKELEKEDDESETSEDEENQEENEDDEE